MSFQLPAHRSTMSARPGWASAAFIVESLLLLVFLVGSLAVFTQVFAAAAQQSAEASALSTSVELASSAAERFAADPTGISPETQEGDFRVVSEVTSDKRAGGTLYRADISVFGADGDDPIYEVTTSRYVSEVD